MYERCSRSHLAQIVKRYRATFTRRKHTTWWEISHRTKSVHRANSFRFLSSIAIQSNEHRKRRSLTVWSLGGGMTHDWIFNIEFLFVFFFSLYFQHRSRFADTFLPAKYCVPLNGTCIQQIIVRISFSSEIRTKLFHFIFRLQNRSTMLTGITRPFNHRTVHLVLPSQCKYGGRHYCWCCIFALCLSQ